MARKIKLPAAVANHPDTNVRLTVDFLLKALEAAKAGNIDLMSTRIRLAYSFERDIPAEIKFTQGSYNG